MMMEEKEEHGCPSSFEPHKNPKKRKPNTTSTMILDSAPFSLSQRAVLSLSKPSYALGLGSKTLRRENRDRLNYLFSKLMTHHQWTQATGVISVLLRGTCKDKSMPNNRFKYTALMEIAELLGTDSNNGTRVKNIYDIWIRKTANMKGKPVENRYLVHIEFIVFCLTQGNIDDAHQGALWLMQENDFGREPVSNMIVGLTFYQLWYSTIPKEMLLEDSDQTFNVIQTPLSRMIKEYIMIWIRACRHQALLELIVYK